MVIIQRLESSLATAVAEQMERDSKTAVRAIRN